MMLTLYGFRGSNNFRKVQVVADYLALDYQTKYLKFFEGEHQQEWFAALNPNLKVPVLKEGDFVLWESNAISRYLCSKVSVTSLYPKDAQIRAQVDQWLSWELAHFNHHFGTMAWEAIAKPQFMDQQPNNAVLQNASENLARFAKVLEQALAGKNYIVGNSITLADYALTHIEVFKEGIPFEWQPYPNINAYFERMRQDEYWKATAVPMEQVGR